MKTPEQERRALEQRAANARAKREGRPMPYPNPWDTWDPTKVPPGASDEEILENYREFSKICRKREPKRFEHDLEPFRPFLEALEETGAEYVVIGDWAVSIYACQIGVEIETIDLELLVPESSVWETMFWARRQPEIEVTEGRSGSAEIAVLHWSLLVVRLLTSRAGVRCVVVLAARCKSTGEGVPEISVNSTSLSHLTEATAC